MTKPMTGYFENAWDICRVAENVYLHTKELRIWTYLLSSFDRFFFFFCSFACSFVVGLYIRCLPTVGFVSWLVN